ncbi:MAG TPA: spore germination protein, partial [Defluviitaleaceae bacterium]|nr:spore germination protein [Defluviitaleaceae bacterium]
MMFFFQILREASLRLPQSIAQAISIVGALILGDTAVQSGLASTIAILLVALTALSAFLAPNIFGAISIWTDILIIFSSLLGLPGFLIGLLLLISHLASLTSCGYPFLYPVGTKDSVQYSDRILRPEIHHLPDSINEDDQK